MNLGERLRRITKELKWLLKVKKRSCDDKNTHYTLKSAQKHADQLQKRFWKRGKIPWKPYKCHFGNHWHVGRDMHPPIRKPRKKR